MQNGWLVRRSFSIFILCVGKGENYFRKINLVNDDMYFVLFSLRVDGGVNIGKYKQIDNTYKYGMGLILESIFLHYPRLIHK